MITTYILMVVLVTSQASKLSTPNNVLRVYQGTEDVTLKYTYVVNIQSLPIGHVIGRKQIFIQPTRICTGSLISANWVLTAAHCCTKLATHIQYGNMSIPLPLTQSKSDVLRTIQHPRFNLGMMVPVDIGLLLVSPVHLDKYGTLSGLDYVTLMGAPIEYAGYGLTFFPKKRTKHMVLKLLTDLFRPLQIGQGVISNCGYLFKGFICVAPKCSSTQLVLQGDSGGPLFHEGKIVGVVTGGLADNFKNTDRYFTPVSPHLSWIRNVIISMKVTTI